MAELIRQGHFLGTKLRSLRKRNGLTLDELSARCVQIDAAGAPSVSYLSLVETGKPMPLEPSFLFAHELLQNALPELLSQTGTTGRQFAQLLIRVWQETRHNNFPDIERAAEECGGRELPLTLDALLAICKRHGLQIKWFDDESGGGLPPGGALIRSRFEAPG